MNTVHHDAGHASILPLITMTRLTYPVDAGPQA
jgi:hypothetical protein